MCPQCRAFITTDDKVCPYCNTPVGPRAIDKRSPGEIMGGLIPHARFTTTLILLINTGLYIAMAVYSMKSGGGGITSPSQEAMINFGIEFPGGSWWRLITAGFLHGSILHILMNSWALYDLGALTEEFYGTSRMIVIYFSATVIGFWTCAHFSVHPALGSSAAIMGLIGAMVAFGIKQRSHGLRSEFIRWAMYGIVLGFFPGVSMAAHIGGLAGGFAVGYLAGPPRLVGYGEKAWRGIAALSVVVTLLAFAAMFVWLARASAQG